MYTIVKRLNCKEMILLKEVQALKDFLFNAKKNRKSIGLVPTMGALHDGHISLITTSTKKCDLTVCSIFVNPTQFNNSNDFEKYPVTIEKDVLLLEKSGCDLLFLPSITEMYPHGIVENIDYNFGEIENLLEGKFRPGHFQGVGQIVHKLLNIVAPDFLFIGQKDFQQCMILKKLVSLIGANTKIEIEETYREKSGLAMSSRNLRLSEQQREQATAIFRMLEFIKNNQQKMMVSTLEKHASDYLLQNGFERIDYVAISNALSLQPLNEIENEIKAVALIAAFIGGIRLIDNMLLN